MNPYYEDRHIRIYNKDCRSMDELPDESVQTVCTSPPYWGLRKYSGDQDLIWGDDNQCEHQWDMPTSAILGFNTLFRPEGEISTPLGLPSKKGKYAETVKGGADRQQKRIVGNFCSLCGAWKGAYGLEPTPEMYIEHTIEILREIRRILRKDGVVFWNIGDSYAGSGSPGGDFRDGKRDEYLRPYPHGKIFDFGRQGQTSTVSRVNRGRATGFHGLKPKDLCLIPFRVAIAAQEDGWWVRSVIIWSKLNTMPESVSGWRWEKHRVKVGNRGRTQARLEGHFQTHSGNKVITDAIWEDCPGCPKCLPNDGYVLLKGSWRPTESHEYLLMLTKTDEYYGDRDAVRELSTERPSGNIERKYRRDYGGPEAHTGCQGFSIPYEPNGTGRNIRSVWTFTTVPFPAFKIGGKKLDHFAVFPEKLPELCIKAGTPEMGCCAKCGAPWARVLEKKPSQFNIRVRDAKAGRATPEEGYKATEEEIERYPGNHPDPGYSKTIGWKPTCKCNGARVPSLVLDPMAGAGTTLWVAKKLNRYAVGYELSQEYCQLAVERCRQQVLL